MHQTEFINGNDESTLEATLKNDFEMKLKDAKTDWDTQLFGMKVP